MATTHRNDGDAPGSRVRRWTNGIGYRYERFFCAGGGAAGIARPLMMLLMPFREQELFLVALCVAGTMVRSTGG